ncbi:MAG: 4Fe-4S binding protein [Desulfobacterales bacterium]
MNADKCIRCGRCYEACPAFGFTWEKGIFLNPSLQGQRKPV